MHTSCALPTVFPIITAFDPYQLPYKWIWINENCTNGLYHCRKKGGDAISHLVGYTADILLYINRWVRARQPVTARAREQAASSLIEHTHARHSRTRSRADLLTQCLIKANRFIATEQSSDAPVTATTPAMAKTAIGKTNLSVVFPGPFYPWCRLRDAEGCCRCAQKRRMMEKQNKCVSCRDELIYYLRNIAVFFKKRVFVAARIGVRGSCLTDRQTDRLS